jgi:hypothetical protein
LQETDIEQEVDDMLSNMALSDRALSDRDRRAKRRDDIRENA